MDRGDTHTHGCVKGQLPEMTKNSNPLTILPARPFPTQNFKTSTSENIFLKQVYL